MIAVLLNIIAIVGGTIYPVEGPSIGVGNIIIEDGVITAIGEDAPIPQGAARIDARNSRITPGFIDAFTHLGLVEIGGVAASNDTNSGYGFENRASQRAVDSFNRDSSLIAIQRAHGVTTVLSALRGGLITGQAGVFSLSRDKPLNPSVALVTGIGGRSSGNRGRTISALREILDDVKAYGADREAFLATRFRPLMASRLDLEALVPVVEHQKPVFVRANRRSDIRAALRFAAEMNIRIVLVGAREAWLEAQAISAAKVPVIVDPSANLPSNFDGIHSRSDNVVLLESAGVEVAISTFSAHQVRKLRQWAGNAVRAGLSHESALEAVTRTPAKILGLEDRGTLSIGQIADIVIWSGDPFEFSSSVKSIIIAGRVVDRDHRQHSLFRRYRTLAEPGETP